MSTAFRMTLSGAEQVPVVVTSAAGLGVAVFDSTAITLTYTIQTTGLDWGPVRGQPAQTPGSNLDDVNGQHFHTGARGANGGVVFDWIGNDIDDFTGSLQPDGSFLLSGTWETTDTGTALTNFQAELANATLGSDVGLYANIHTVANGGGEIRGQLVCIATDNSETIIGTAGIDVLPGLGGDDTIKAGAGNDVLDGGTGNNNLFGEADNDALNGGASADFMDGGPGQDILNGGGGFNIASWLSELSGLTLNLTNQSLNAGSAAGDTVSNAQVFYLTNSADTFVADTGLYVYGFGGVDTITGSAQSDFIDGGAGGDTIDAGGGFDYVSWNFSAAAVTVNLVTPASNTGDAAGDTISNADAYILTEQGDTFVGLDVVQNIAFGFGGNDTFTGGFNTNNWFFGGDGDDRMVGGGVADLYSGGAGADTIVLIDADPLAGSSVIGFETGSDKIEISRSVFGLSGGFTLTAGTTFISGASPTATGATPTFLYNTTLNILSFDLDGTGATAASVLMQFDTAVPLATTDFVLV
jgi:Ca2+-binding RTX toxin-like protein